MSVLFSFGCTRIQMNYFLAHATTNRYVRSVGAEPGHTASIIGCPNLSACLVALVHCGVLSKLSACGRSDSGNVRAFRWVYLGSSLFGVIGNVIVARSVVNESIANAVLGRFLIGFGSTDVLQRQVLCWCSKSHIALEAARLVRYRVAGIVIGLMAGAAADLFSFPSTGVGSGGMHSTCWLMASLWLFHSFQIVVQFRTRQGVAFDTSDESTNRSAGDFDHGEGDDSDSDSSEVAEIGTPSSLLYQKSFDLPSETRLAEADPLLIPASSSPARQRKYLSVARQWKGFTSRLFKLLMYRLCIPLCFVVHAFVAVSTEAVFTSSPIIASRYFGWSGAHAATLLGACSALILPVYFACEWIARRYEERIVIKVLCI
jgi:hypothetical protein